MALNTIFNEIQNANNILDENTNRYINEIFETFGRQDPFDLVNLTHSYNSWINAWRNPFDSIITNADIEECHRQLLQDFGYIF